MERHRKNSQHASKPYVSNYPSLQEWLDKIEARCDWQQPLGQEDEPRTMVEQWRAPGGRPFLVMVYGNGNGWNIFTDCADNRVPVTLADAELRMRAPLPVKPEDKP